MKDDCGGMKNSPCTHILPDMHRSFSDEVKGRERERAKVERLEMSLNVPHDV